MGKLLFKFGVAGVVTYGVVYMARKFNLVEKATVLVDELLTKVYAGSLSTDESAKPDEPKASSWATATNPEPKDF